MSSLTFDLKINRVHLLFSIWSLKAVKQRVCKILSGQNIPISSVNWPWTFDLKINRGLPLLTNNVSPTHKNRMKGSQDIERKSSGLPIDLPTGAKQYAPLLRRGGGLKADNAPPCRTP
jgi:hypothetical protein